MPKDKDIHKLAEGLTELIKSKLAKLKDEGPNQEDALILIQACLVYFVLFNRKRDVETSCILLSDYIEAKGEKIKNDPELMVQLSPLEKKMAQQFLLMKIVGKCK